MNNTYRCQNNVFLFTMKMYYEDRKIGINPKGVQ